jgi:hypothetical protein
MKRAWTDEGVELIGRHFAATGNTQLPRPVQFVSRCPACVRRSTGSRSRRRRERQARSPGRSRCPVPTHQNATVRPPGSPCRSSSSPLRPTRGLRRVPPEWRGQAPADQLGCAPSGA